ncbi:MAG TPA: MBL fold metallo-hydrolase [Tepidisphaeraceae bacterium]|jgi:L-ascorbate metabolism protein UlaG (beta-lactamase superfamily)
MIEPFLFDEAFVADVESAERSPDLLHLWWLGQSGFLLQRGDIRVLGDPYLSDSLTKKYANTDKPHVRMSRRVVDPFLLRRINVITASHAHTDHLDGETLAAIRTGDAADAQPTKPHFVAPHAIRELAEQRWGGSADILLDAGESKPFGEPAIYAVASAHDEVERNEHGWCKYLGYVIEMGPFTVYHSGDTVLHDDLVESLSRFSIDVALLPINGRAPERRVAGNLWGREAAALAKDIGANLVVPCHYDMFEFNTATPDEFVDECERLGQAYKVLRLGERLTISDI